MQSVTPPPSSPAQASPIPDTQQKLVDSSSKQEAIEGIHGNSSKQEMGESPKSFHDVLYSPKQHAMSSSDSNSSDGEIQGAIESMMEESKKQSVGLIPQGGFFFWKSHPGAL